MNDAQMKRINEKYPAVLKGFKLSFMQLMHTIGVGKEKKITVSYLFGKVSV